MDRNSRSKWLGLLAMAMLAAIAVATLIPAGMQIRLGLHWLVEHFLAYFAVTALFCLAWPRPMAVAAVLLPVAILLEMAQGLTPDRVPDAATALSAVTGVAVAALVVDLVIALRGRGAEPGGKRAFTLRLGALARPKQM
jgi:VanZ family protein